MSRQAQLTDGLPAMQKRMEETRALFRDPEATQFVIVTIPTAMAAAESARLAKALLEQQVSIHPWCLAYPLGLPAQSAPNGCDEQRAALTATACAQVPVRMMVVNQVVAGAATEQFMNMRRRDQQRALGMLRSLPALR